MKKCFLLGLFLLGLVACSTNDTDELRDPGTMSRTDYIEISYKMKPHIKKARQSLPYAKKVYKQGLKNGEKLFLTIKLYDVDGSFEQVEVQVEDWYADTVLGKITSQIYVLQHYQTGELIDFSEDAIIDWTLVHADGKHEGGYVRKFLAGCGARR